RRAPRAARAVDEEGPGVAPSAGAADGVATVASGPAARGDRGPDAPGGTARGELESASETLVRRAPPAEHPRGGPPHGRGGGRLHRRPASLPRCQGGRGVLRVGPEPGPVGRPESAGAHHARGAGGGPPVGGGGELAGGAAVADGPGVLRAGAARRPA